MSGPSIGIVGAGTGGLTIALASRHVGLDDLVVYEQAEHIEAVGAGIQLSPNATRVLHALGLRNALHEIAFYPEAVHLRTWRTGYLIAMRPLGGFSESRYGAPYLHVHRGDLQQLLLAAAENAGIEIRTGCELTGIDQDDAQVRLTFADGSTAAHAAVIGCDGIHSRVRTALFDPAPPRFTGHLAWRGLVPVERLPQDLLLPTVTAWLGPRKHFVNYFVRGGSLVNFVGVVEDDSWRSESWREPGDAARLRADFADWNPVIGHIIDAAEAVFRWALHDHAPLERWTSNRVTLLGDACHPMLPYLAQGAAMAIEDAWVLSRMLERWDDQPMQALADYERYRKPRATRVQTASRTQGATFHLHERWQILARNLKLGLGSRYLPEIAMQQFDWLHGYDCVKGFD